MVGCSSSFVKTEFIFILVSLAGKNGLSCFITFAGYYTIMINKYSQFCYNFTIIKQVYITYMKPFLEGSRHQGWQGLDNRGQRGHTGTPGSRGHTGRGVHST